MQFVILSGTNNDPDFSNLTSKIIVKSLEKRALFKSALCNENYKVNKNYAVVKNYWSWEAPIKLEDLQICKYYWNLKYYKSDNREIINNL